LKKELSIPAVIGLIVAVLAVVGGVGFFLMNRTDTGGATKAAAKTSGGKAMIVPGSVGEGRPAPPPADAK